MKLYTADTILLSLVMLLCTLTLSGMEHKKIDPTNLKLCLSNYSGNFQKKITYKQAEISPFLKNLINPEEKENRYVFDAFIGDEAIKVFVSYLQAYNSHESVMLGEGKMLSRQLFVEKEIVSKKFTILSDLLALAQTCGVSSLDSFVKSAIVTKMLHDDESQKILGNDLAQLIRDYGLEKLFIVMKDNLVKNPKFYHDEPLSVSQEKKIFDVTLSPDSKFIVITSHKEGNVFLGSFYTCCSSLSTLKTFEIHKTKDAFLFTPDNKHCVVCSDDMFKIIDMQTLSSVKTFLGDSSDTYRFFVMSPDGTLLLVTTGSGNCFVYERSDKTGLFEKSKKTFKVHPYGIKPVFSQDSKDFFSSQGSVLYRHTCSTSDTQEMIFEQSLENVCISPKGNCIGVLMPGCYKVYSSNLEKLLLSENVDEDVRTQGFFSPDGSLFALASGKKCCTYAYGNGDLLRLEQFSCRNAIAQGAFFGDQPYLMLCDDMYCDIYDYCDQKLLREINLMCLDGATILVSNGGSHLIITCDHTSTIYGTYPLQSFFKVMNKLLGQGTK